MQPGKESVDEREIFTSGPVVVFKWRNAPGWPVEFASRNVLDVFGHPPDAFLSGAVAYSDLIHPQDLERVGAEVTRASGSTAEEFTHQPYRVCRADGAVIWLYDHTNILRDPVTGEISHYQGYVIDITAQIQAEEANRELQEQLLHSQKLESLGLLAGSLAHDFNNVLTGILGHANLANHALQSAHERDPKLVEAISQVEALSLQAGELCKQLLAYSGQGKFVVQPIDLAQLVRELAGMLQVAISKKATLELRLAEDTPTVSGDRGQIQQVLMNLISNASEALGEGSGKITLSLEERELGEEELSDVVLGSATLTPGRFVSLSVGDDGVGMNAETQARLFDPFFTTKFTGRGLGLAAVLGIMRGHRGAIRLSSEVGVGSTFELLFPRSGAEVHPQRTVPTAELGAGQGRVLLVDDEQVVRRVGRMMLEILGYDVDTVEDGEQALRKIEEQGDRYSLVLLDLTMPSLSGHETLRELRRLQPRLPVILSSGFNEEGAIGAESDPSLLAFLQKPYRLEDLAEVAARLVADR